MVLDGDFRRRCGAGARQRIESGLDAATVGRETVKVYRELLAMEPLVR